MAAAAFGNVILHDNNQNCEFKGNSNSGEFMGNGNIQVNAIGSFLKIFKTKNCQIRLDGSELTADSCTNIDVSGKNNKLVLKSENNLSIKGDSNDCQLKSNSNFKYSGNNGTGKYTQNSNAKITGDENRVNADKNNNLKVIGNKNNLDIFGTYNHVVEAVHGLKDCNYFEPTLTENSTIIGSSSFLSSYLPNWSNRSSSSSSSAIQYIVKYLNSGRIQEHHYELGLFKFDVEESVGDSNVHLRLDEGAMRADSVEILELSRTTCLLEAKSGPISQKLKIAGHNIQKEDSAQVKLIIGCGPNAGFP